MNTIQRYVLRQFVKTYLMTFLCLVGIFIIADFVGHLSEFMDRTPENGSLIRRLLSFYGARVPWFFDIAGRLVALLTVVFVIAWLQRHGEMTALQAAGISRWRILGPLFWACAVVAVIAAANRELGIPRVRELLCQDASDGAHSRPRSMVPRYDPESNILFDGKELFPSARQIQQLSLRLPTSWEPWGRSVHANVATFVPATDDHPTGYLLEGIGSPSAGMAVTSYRHGDRVVIHAPAEASWLPPDTYFVVCRLPIEAFQDGQRWRLYNSTFHLIRGVRSGELEGAPDVRLAIHTRAIQPLLDLSLIFLGVPFVLEAQRRNFFLSAAKTVVVGSVFTLVVVLCHSLGLQGMVTPYFAAWLPLMILAPMAVLLSAPLAR